MQVTIVQIKVKPESVEAFKAATMKNARASRQEPGVLRFDMCQQADDPSRFVLYEAYTDVQAVGAHKETSHYKVWRDTVAEMMAEPRVGLKYLGE